MNETPRATELQEAILDFERRIKMSPKPDDVPAWMEGVKASFDRMEAHVQRRRRRIHDKLFVEIAELEPSRLEQIQQLRAVDEDIEKRLEVVKTHAIILLLENEPDEGNIEERVLDFLGPATELIYWIKQQEETVAKWFAEAFAAEA